MNQVLRLLVLVSLFIAGCSSKEPGQLGELSDRHYANQHFGISLDLPESWQLQSADFNKMLTEMGEDAVVGDDAGKRAAMKLSQKNTFTIFTVTEHEVGTPGVLNPMVICLVERLTYAPGVKSADDYRSALVEFFKQSATPVTIVSASEHEQFNGIEFSTLATAMKTGGVDVSQKYRILFVRGYALALISMYFDEASEAKVDGIVGTISRI